MNNWGGDTAQHWHSTLGYILGLILRFNIGFNIGVEYWVPYWVEYLVSILGLNIIKFIGRSKYCSQIKKIPRKEGYIKF